MGLFLPAIAILGARDLGLRLSMARAKQRLPEGVVRLDSGHDVEMKVGLHNHKGKTRRALRVTVSRPPGPIREGDPKVAELLRRTRHLLAFEPTAATVSMVFSRLRKPKKTAHWAARVTDAIARTSPWADASRSLGLSLEPNGRMTGEIDGLGVHVRARDDRTRVRVRIPTTVRAVHADHVLEFAQPTGNPVLDQLAKVSGPLEVHDAEVVEALLAVVHGYPGSRVDGDGVRLDAAGAVEDVAPLVHAAIRLARRLQTTLSRSAAAAPAGPDPAR
ncbi:MAG: hypothetical protein GY913_03900 [Proteobacteria bacterium]|nr:hypothetical protein [Pseudomonadota bacterium]MCP4916046.1 hypothetical protein [Pseudomonadota bacterium]